MKLIAYPGLWLSMLLVLVLGFSPGGAHAQSAEKTAQPITPGSEMSGMPGQHGREGLQEAQGDGRPMTCV